MTDDELLEILRREAEKERLRSKSLFWASISIVAALVALAALTALTIIR